LSLQPYKWWERIRLQVEALFKAFTLLDRQHQLKQIAASQHVLKTYHDSFLFGKVPLSVKLRALLRTGTVSFVWHIVHTLCTISCQDFCKTQSSTRLMYPHCQIETN
jgi:hypothetical protein